MIYNRNERPDYVVLSTGEKFNYSGSYQEKYIGNYITTITMLYIEDEDSLIKIIEEHYDDGISSYTKSRKENFLGIIDYAYTKQNLADAKQLIFMEKYFPDLKPVNVSPIVKRLIEELKGGKL